MDPVEVIEGKVSVLARADVDTDQIIPKQFLKRIERSGFGEFLFPTGSGPGRSSSSPIRSLSPAALWLGVVPRARGGAARFPGSRP